MTSCIIIDDEQKARTNLRNMLGICSIQVNILAEFSKPSEAIEFLKSKNVDCIFLDIEMPEMDGFKFIDHIDTAKTRITFVTAHSKYSIRALRANALDYLLKPLDIDELETSLERLVDDKQSAINKDQSVYDDSLKNLLQAQVKGKLSSKITIPQTNGFKIVDSKKIIRILGEGAYSRLFIHEGKPELVTRNLGHFEEVLEEEKFVRVHNSIIINLDYMTEFTSVDGGTLTMIDGSEIIVARRRLKHFKTKVDAYIS